ncbi:hypothetical protein [Macrococcoides caseolyticum]|uniref:hypothetical protein n=1 Tax=Macrococcoides caseolyticum TaxID=69966 RepID=UPI002A2431F6|nr:hypothetical protein [Macrococcus caseolyticus]
MEIILLILIAYSLITFHERHLYKQRINDLEIERNHYKYLYNERKKDLQIVKERMMDE